MVIKLTKLTPPQAVAAAEAGAICGKSTASFADPAASRSALAAAIARTQERLTSGEVSANDARPVLSTLESLDKRLVEAMLAAGEEEADASGKAFSKQQKAEAGPQLSRAQRDAAHARSISPRAAERMAEEATARQSGQPAGPGARFLAYRTGGSWKVFDTAEAKGKRIGSVVARCDNRSEAEAEAARLNG